MKKSYHILYIDIPSHVVETFDKAIREAETDKDFCFRVSKTYTLPQALSFMDNGSVDLVFMDAFIFSSSDWLELAKDTLVRKIIESPPKIGVMLISHYTDHFHMRYMLRHLRPLGFVIKKEMNQKEITSALYHFVNHIPYYSKTVVKYLADQGADTYLLDEEDHLLLYLLSQFYTMKMIAKKMTLSLSAIEKRKRRLKDLFGVEKSPALIKKAKEQGFI